MNHLVECAGCQGEQSVSLSLSLVMPRCLIAGGRLYLVFVSWANVVGLRLYIRAGDHLLLTPNTSLSPEICAPYVPDPSFPQEIVHFQSQFLCSWETCALWVQHPIFFRDFCAWWVPNHFSVPNMFLGNSSTLSPTSFFSSFCLWNWCALSPKAYFFVTVVHLAHILCFFFWEMCTLCPRF